MENFYHKIINSARATQYYSLQPKQLQKNPMTDSKTLLTHFMPLISFDTPWKYQKTKGFMMFSGGIKRDPWHEMG